MHRALASRCLNNALSLAERPARLELPVFLCPSVRTASYYTPRSSIRVSSRLQDAPWITTSKRCVHMQADASTTITPASDPPAVLSIPQKTLPRQCRGCGALSQTSHPNQAGYFDLDRKAVQKYLGTYESSYRSRAEDKIYEDALRQHDAKQLEEQGVDVQALALSLPPAEARPQTAPKPLCDRCHYLLYNHTGESIYHPDIESIRDTLLESPYKYNHVYHVLDAADFPMSLLPKISQFLDTMPLRSRNRRSKTGRFYHGQKTEISFVISRADLLAPTKPQVDTLFPYLREVLRDALGRTGRDIRLGNLRAVSAKRSWWTKELREDIWKRGGGGWMLGKANVGKSQLFEAVFPKGRMNWDPSKHQITVDMEAKANEDLTMRSKEEGTQDDADQAQDDLSDEYSLLPPAPKETQFPEMPIVSDLPGTTASPIRVPFGNGRGELIDLPGLERTGLERHVRKESRLSLLMQSRIVPDQITLRPSQSLLLGGFIRITPREPAPIMLAYAFTPIEPHVCRTDKAIGIQNHTREVNVENIALLGTGDKTELAGSFELRWDVTKQRTGPITRKNAVGLDVDRLPYRVLSTDILIEGVGWVEIVAQVRTKDLYRPRTSLEKPETEVKTELDNSLSDMERLEAVAEGKSKKLQAPLSPTEQKPEDEPNWPIVDVYSPEGKFISCRKPMNGWMLNKPRVTAASQKSRPRKSMKGAKKLEKKHRREREAAVIEVVAIEATYRRTRPAGELVPTGGAIAPHSALVVVRVCSHSASPFPTHSEHGEVLDVYIAFILQRSSSREGTAFGEIPPSPRRLSRATPRSIIRSDKVKTDIQKVRRHRSRQQAPGPGSRTQVQAQPSSGSATQTQSTTPQSPAPRILRLRGAHPPSANRVQWAEGVVDNEGLGRKKSKVCCIYHAPKAVGESSDESSSDSSSGSDSDSDPDSDDKGSYDARERAIAQRKARDGQHNHGSDCNHSSGRDSRHKPTRRPSPNAYERQPRRKQRSSGRDAGPSGSGSGPSSRIGRSCCIFIAIYIVPDGNFKQDFRRQAWCQLSEKGVSTSISQGREGITVPEPIDGATRANQIFSNYLLEYPSHLDLQSVTLATRYMLPSSDSPSVATHRIDELIVVLPTRDDWLANYLTELVVTIRANQAKE
ncbi:hypothetical protein CIB48_g9145 [Xylaria polymorpha]|nr:hypothetical protein CIB48_g9145 [Xylaria polymorpha]